MDKPRVVVSDSQTDREANVAFKFACGGCLLGFATGAAVVLLVWSLW